MTHPRERKLVIYIYIYKKVIFNETSRSEWVAVLVTPNFFKLLIKVLILFSMVMLLMWT